MILGFGGFSILLAVLHNSVRKYIFHDEHNLDTTFDAGGNVSLSLTAVTVASQLFWPGDILHSATLTTKVYLLMAKMPVLFFYTCYLNKLYVFIWHNESKYDMKVTKVFKFVY